MQAERGRREREDVCVWIPDTGRRREREQLLLFVFIIIFCMRRRARAAARRYLAFYWRAVASGEGDAGCVVCLMCVCAC